MKKAHEAQKLHQCLENPISHVAAEAAGLEFGGQIGTSNRTPSATDGHRSTVWELVPNIPHRNSMNGGQLEPLPTRLMNGSIEVRFGL